MSKRVALGFDHAAFNMREELIDIIKASGAVSEVVSMGSLSASSVDYPDYAQEVCEAIMHGKVDYGVLVCGTGIGMSIAANKFHGIRAALCFDHVTAQLARQHNDAHVVCVGVRTSGMEIIRDILTTFLTTEFSTEGRHGGRVSKIADIEKKEMKEPLWNCKEVHNHDHINGNHHAENDANCGCD